jgi:hypothetical protein
MILYYLRLRRHSPQEGEYNPLQKMAYTGVFVILTPLVFLSGLAMSPQLNVAFHWLPAIFGGRQAARSVHFVLAFGFVLFTFGHVFMVLTTGVLNNMRSIVTGWYREKVPGPKPEENVPPEPRQPAPSERDVSAAEETADHFARTLPAAVEEKPAAADSLEDAAERIKEAKKDAAEE